MTTETLRTQRKTVLKKNCLLRDLSVSVVWVRFWLQWILLPARRFGGWEAGETITTETPRGTERSLRDLCVSVVWVWFSFLVAAMPRCASVVWVRFWLRRGPAVSVAAGSLPAPHTPPLPHRAPPTTTPAA